MDRLKRGKEFIGLSIEDSVVSYREGILLFLACLEALFWRQFSWLKASLLFVFHFLVLFQLIVRWCMVFFYIFCLDFPSGLFIHPLVLYTSILATSYESLGGCYHIDVDTLRL